MAQKACTKCMVVKPYEQFSKNRAAKDGLQWHCKECNNKDRVGNTNTIYSITAPNGDVYIGFTQRKKFFRLNEHKKFYRAGAKHKLPLLWESFDRYGIDNHKFEILKQFEGTKSEGLEMEGKLIQVYKSINKSLNVKD